MIKLGIICGIIVIGVSHIIEAITSFIMLKKHKLSRTKLTDKEFERFIGSRYRQKRVSN